MKQFATAARRGEGAVTNSVDIEFEFEATPDNYVTMVAHPPTTGQLALFFAHNSDGGTAGVRSLFDLLDCVLDPEHYALIEQQLRDGVDVAVIIEIVQYLVAEWSARPTGPPTASPSSRKTTGPRSTVKRPAAALTTSNSQ